MISVSSEFKTAIKQKSRQFTARFKDGNNVVDCDIEYVKCYKGSCGDTLSYGCSYASRIEASLKRCSIDLNGKRLEYQVGLKVGNSYQYITMGFFTVLNPKNTSGTITFTAVGVISRLSNSKFPNTHYDHYPITLEDVLNDIGQILGVNIYLLFSEPYSEYTPTDRPLVYSPPQGTVREVLFKMVQTFGGFVTEDSHGNLLISQYNAGFDLTHPSAGAYNQGDILEVKPYMYINPPEFADTYTVTGLKITGKDGYSYEKGTPVLFGTSEYVYSTAIFNTICNYIVGMEFEPANVDLALGDPRLEPWDCLEVEDLNGDKHIVPCFEIIHTYNGGFTTEVKSNIKTKDEDDAQTQGPLTSLIANRADYVAEQGTKSETGITWTYRKWDSGIAECWGYTATASIACTTALSGSSVYYSAEQTIAFPSGLFNDIPRNVQVSVWDRGYGTYGNISSWNKNNFLFYYYSPKSQTREMDANILAIGRWK